MCLIHYGLVLNLSVSQWGLFMRLSLLVRDNIAHTAHAFGYLKDCSLSFMAPLSFKENL